MPSYGGRNPDRVGMTLPCKLPLTLMLGTEGITVGLDARNYEDGAGSVKVRARIKVKDEQTVVMKEIPPPTTTESLLASIEDAARKGMLKVKAINDFTSEKVEIKVNASPAWTQNVSWQRVSERRMWAKQNSPRQNREAEAALGKPAPKRRLRKQTAAQALTRFAPCPPNAGVLGFRQKPKGATEMKHASQATDRPIRPTSAASAPISPVAPWAVFPHKSSAPAPACTP